MNSTMTIIVSLTVSGSLLALALIALRLFLKNRVSKAFQYYIWLLVLLRLVLPVTFHGSVMDGLFARTAEAPAANGFVSTDDRGDAAGIIPSQTGGRDIQHGISDTPSMPLQSETNTQVADPTRISFNLWAFVLEHQTVLWLLGAALHLGWFVVAYLRFARNIKKTCIQPHSADREVFETLRGGARVRLTCNPYVDTPILIGFFSPCIVIPQPAFVPNGRGEALQNILRHELAHCRRHDLLLKWFVVLVSSLHWFNPLMIWVRREISRACELSCDEAVIRRLTPAERQGYGDTLLLLAANRRLPAGIVVTTMCEEKRALKERLMGIMHYRKKTPWMIALSLVLSLLVAGCGAILGAVDVPDSGMGGDVAQTSDGRPSPAPALAQMLDPSIEIPEGMDGAFHDWTTILTVPRTQDTAVFYGITVGGDRRDNLLIVERAEQDAYTQYTILLKTGEAAPVSYTFLTAVDAIEYGMEVQSTDLDGDGTDEIIFNLDYYNSGGWCDTHVLTLKNGSLYEILTALNPDNGNEYNFAMLDQYADSRLITRPHFHGMRPIRRADGLYVLQATWTGWDDGDDSLMYNEYRYDGDGWTEKYPEDGPYIITPADREQYARELLGGDPRLPAQFNDSWWPEGYYANLDDLGIMDDMVYWHYLYGDDEPNCAVVEAYTNADPGTPLLKTYWNDEEQGAYTGVRDLDDDGISEIVVVLGDTAGCEIHVLKPSGGTLAEVLTAVEGRPDAEDEYAATLLPVDVDWNWCNIETYQGKDMLALYLADGSGKAYMGWNGSHWDVMNE